MDEDLASSSTISQEFREVLAVPVGGRPKFSAVAPPFRLSPDVGEA
jgi:hypothetical protein